MIRKTYWPFRDLGIMGSGGIRRRGCRAGSGVNVRQQMVLGPFQVARLGGSSGSAVTDWLRTNGYVVPATLAANLTPYLTEKWEIVAVKLAPRRDGESLSGATPPLRLTFASDRIVYPMRLSKGATTDADGDRVRRRRASGRRHQAAGRGREAGAAVRRPGRGRRAWRRRPTILTAYTVTYRDPSRITDDFTFARRRPTTEFQRVEYVTRTTGCWSTIGVLSVACCCSVPVRR